MVSFVTDIRIINHSNNESTESTESTESRTAYLLFLTTREPWFYDGTTIVAIAKLCCKLL
jgi:hypothetical protein